MVKTVSLHGTQCVRVGVWQCRLSKSLGSVWNCLWGHALKRSPGIIRKSRVSYTDTGFLSSATWPSLPKKHYNGLIRKTKGQGNFVNLGVPNARKRCGGAAGIRSFLKTRFKMAASVVIFIDILEN